MEEENEVIVETETPQEIETPETTPEKDYKQMFEDQRRRAEKAEQEAKGLQSRLKDSNVLLDEESPVDKDSVVLKKKLSELEHWKNKSEVIESNPILKETWSDFESFCEMEDNKGMSMKTAAKAFLIEKGLLDPQRKGLEKPTGGSKVPSSTNMTMEEVKKLRETNFRKYSDMLKKDQIKV